MPDRLTKALLEEILSVGKNGFAFCQDESQVIEFNGQKFTPDATKGYIKFTLSHAFPVITVYSQALHPNVIAQSFNSMLHQGLNFEHVVQAYDKDKNTGDRFIGTIVAVDFPRAPMSGWKVGDKETSPGIEAVASFNKLARGMDRVIGQHQTGRHNYSVSMEVQYPYKDCAFAVALNGKSPKNETPDDMVQAGWELIPWTVADEELLACFSVKKNRIVSDWKSRKVVQLMGGIDKPVHYSGVGLVAYGAEREAGILQMTASQSGDTISQTLAPLKYLAGVPLQSLLSQLKPSAP